MLINKENDTRDEIIRTQMDVIGTLIENNLKNIANDFWGDRPSVDTPNTPAETPEAPAPAQTQSTEKEAEPEALPVENIEDIKKELDQLIGLDGIKREVKNLINMVSIHKLREKEGLKTVDMSLHMVFSGNPGTGKTTIARIMARIYRSLGILSKGQLVEVDRSGLVAGYVGQTAIKTGKVIESAKGGVLFIDEAYSLSSKSENDFGSEAIETLLKAMEDNREDLIVVVAGYDGLMDEFIHSNPGLESRFNRYLHFDDYTLDEMIGIFKLQLRKGEYTLGEGAEEALRSYIEEANTSSVTFGNARGVRNIFEKVLTEQANRLSAISEDLDRQQLMTLTKEDIEAARLHDDRLSKLIEEQAQLEKNAEEALDALQQLSDDLKSFNQDASAKE